MISRRKFIAGVLGTGIGVLLIDGLWLEQFFFETNIYDIGDSNKQGNTLKFAQITDLHLQSVSWHHRKLAQKTNEQNPDLLLLTGDSIDKGHKLNELDEFMSLLDHDTPKLAIMGNWEYWGKVDVQALRQLYEKHNCTLLINESITLTIKGERVQFTGLDCILGGDPFRNQPFKGLEVTPHHFVLVHCPSQIDIIAQDTARFGSELPITYLFSGHTHGGQVAFFGWAPFTPMGSGMYTKGWYNYGGFQMYVSKGFGTSVLPLRIGARSELTIFNYHTG